MLNLFRNVNQRIVKNQFLLNQIIKSIDKTVTRQSSILCRTHEKGNSSHLSWKQQLLQRTQLPHLHFGFYSTDSENPPPNENEGEKIERILPRIVEGKIEVGPSLFTFIKTRIKAFQIRSSLDSEFNLMEFLDGSKKAVEVIFE